MCFSKKGDSQVQISGIATLCFDENGSWFQGSISTEDDSQFAIYGIKSPRIRLAQEEISSTEYGDFTSEEEQPGVPVTFDIRVVDCDVGEEYSLKKVNGRNGELCTFSCSCVTFTTEEVFRGHRADLIAQQCLGHKMAGKKTHVYRGPIRLHCAPTPRNFHWVL
ncbi:uncharacterized protein LOC135203211 [Macrobrachium nipponense]|uniref:uncharacterized protein LOC135203211 n=1 Tax=Macrobrachium nipponense TaxID=159736 RepID=UPI0030C84C21